MTRRPLKPSLFPYTTLFRSRQIETLLLELLRIERDVPGLQRAAGKGRQLVVLALRHGPALRGELESEEHTSELQSRLHLVCRLLLEKKKYHFTTNVRTRRFT